MDEKWKSAKEVIKNLSDAYKEVDKNYSLFDGHCMWSFCKDEPEKAAIALYTYHEIMYQLIHIKNILDKIPSDEEQELERS